MAISRYHYLAGTSGTSLEDILEWIQTEKEQTGMSISTNWPSMVSTFSSFPSLAKIMDQVMREVPFLDAITQQSTKHEPYNTVASFSIPHVDFVYNHADAIVYVGLALWFRFWYMTKESVQLVTTPIGTVQSGRESRDHKVRQRHGGGGWWWRRWHDPFTFYATLAFCHPAVQTILWPTVDSMVSYHVPVHTILSSLDIGYFVGTALWYRFLNGANHRPSSPSTTSKGTPSRRRFVSSPQDAWGQAELYQRKRAMQYKDPKLYDFINQCQSVKQNLRPVKDPWMERSEKLARIRQAQPRRAQSQGNLQLTADQLQALKQSLHKTIPTNHETNNVQEQVTPQ